MLGKKYYYIPWGYEEKRVKIEKISTQQKLCIPSGTF